MMLSNDGGFQGAVWEPFNTHKAWTLNSFDGHAVTMNVQVRFGDANGNELSNSRSFDDIVLDITPPTGSVAVGGGSAPAGQRTSAQSADAPVSAQSPVRAVQLT